MMLNWLRERLAGRFGREDGIRLVASFILATLLWGWVSLVTDPEVRRLFGTYQITYEPLEGDLLIVTSLPQVTVRLTGPDSVIDEVSPEEVTVSIDTSEIDEPGTYRLPVRVDAPDGVRERQTNPASISIEVERTVVVNHQLVPEYRDLQEDDPREVVQLEPEHSEVTVSGPQSAVERVARVILPIEIGARTQSFEGEFTPVAVDQDGVGVPEVDIAPDRVLVRLSITSRGRAVAVLTRVEGEPAEGYEVVDRTSVPPSIQVDGQDDVLASSVTVLTEPVDITGASQTVTRRVALDLSTLPPGVRVIEPADHMVQVVVQIAQQGVNQTLPDQPVEVVGLGGGLEASVEPATVAVTIVASQEQLESLAAGDITVTVDLAGLGPGTHELTPGVSVPPNTRWVRSEPERVTVVIEPAAAGTPTGSPEPMPSTPNPAGVSASPPAAGRLRRDRA